VCDFSKFWLVTHDLFIVQHLWPVGWTAAAARDLQNLSDYLEENHPQYRHVTLRKVCFIIQSLKEWPY
jgi:hypothetical protein